MPADNIPGPEDYPDTVGDRPKYHVDKACHIGSGHFGAVYGGFFGKGALRKEVAIKFEKQTSHHNGFRESWYERDVLQMMDGKGCPHVYWSGRKGDRRIIVMDRGGPTLQAAMDARAPNRRLRADEVSALGMQAIIQLRNLHMMGFIHGDIKPDNFLLPFGQDISKNNDLSKAGLFTVDLGLASKWQSSSGAHIPYQQQVAHFRGTVRYASINVHVGRTLSRRDDLESLLYTLLYLLHGRLPWQGLQEHDDKGMQVCEVKCRLTAPQICTTAPTGMQYFLSYIRNLKFDETPNYEYLLTCLDFTDGLNDIKLLQSEKKKEEDAAAAAKAAATATPGTPAATAAAAAAAAAAKTAKPPANKPTVLGKRARDALVADPAEGRRQKLSKRHITAECLVQPRSAKHFQWIIVTMNSRDNPTRQHFTSHTTYANLQREVEKHWAEGLRVNTLCFGSNLWTAVMNSGEKLTKQSLLCWNGLNHEENFPEKWVREKWDAGYYITCLTGNHSCWGIVCSIMPKRNAFTKQSYMINSTFPNKWIKEKWQEGYFISSVAVQGSSPRQRWAVIMSRNAPYMDQVVEVDYVYPSKSIHARWDAGFRITGVAAASDQVAYVLSKPRIMDWKERCIRTSHAPLDKLRKEWDDSYFLTSLSYGRIL